tara:strand:- start:284 stop:1291 length:1008 start_codon:yes stop_codon:yes gene_type:complete
MLNKNKRDIIQNKFGLEIKEPHKLNVIDFTNSKKTTRIKKNPLINDKDIIDDKIKIIFGGNTFLSLDQPKLDVNDIVYVCIYIIVNNKKPILLYSLFKSNEDNMLNFYKFIYTNGIVSNEIIYKLKNNFTEWKNTDFKYNGYIKYKNSNILFFNCDINEEYENTLVKVNNKFNFVMISEIINYGKSFDLKINNYVSDFLLNNSNFCFLYDNKDNMYEVPVVSYNADVYSKIFFYITLGYRKNYIYNGENYYIFMDYQSSTDKLQSYENNIEQQKGIIKYALFLGDQYIISETNNDEINKHYDSLRINIKKSDKLSSIILLNNKKQFYPIGYLHYN